MAKIILVEDSDGKQTILNLDNVAYIVPHQSDYEKSEVIGSKVYFNRPNEENNPILFKIPFEDLIEKWELVSGRQTSNQRFV